MPSLVFISDSTNRIAIPLNKATMTLGRTEGVDIYLPDISVSRNHARIFLNGNEFELYDNGALNEINVNGKAVQHCILKHNDVIRIGAYRLRLDLQDGGPLPKQSVGVSKHQQPLPAVARTAIVIQPRSVSASSIIPLGVSSKRTHLLANVRPPRRRSAIPAPGSNYAFISFIFGWMGLIAFVPAIVLGHIASIPNARARFHRNFGLTLGYLSFSFWAVVWFCYADGWSPSNWWNSSPQILHTKAFDQGELTPPSVSAALPMLAGSITWTPSPDLFSEIFIKNHSNLSSSSEAETSFRDFLKTWKDGVIVYEPNLVRQDLDPLNPQMIRFVIEDSRAPGTAWGYNNVVTSEKKPVIGPFYLPSLGPDLFCQEDQTVFNVGSRGVQWSRQSLNIDLQRNVSNLRWMVLLKPSAKPVSMKVHAHDNSFDLQVFPAEVLAQVVYSTMNEEVLGVRLNDSLYDSNERESAKAMIASNLKNIISQKSSQPNEIPKIFHLYTPFATASNETTEH